MTVIAASFRCSRVALDVPWRSSINLRFPESEGEGEARYGSQAEDLKAIIGDTKGWFRKRPASPSENPHEQLSLSRDAVFRSWWTPKANITAPWKRFPTTSERRPSAGYGVRQYGRHFGTGVGFTRDPAPAKRFLTANF